METKQYVITKKIAKHGSQSVICIPNLLEKKLRPRIIAKIIIGVLED